MLLVQTAKTDSALASFTRRSIVHEEQKMSNQKTQIPPGLDKTDKIKILTLSDHPMLPSGVGTQTKYICEALLKTGKFRILSLGGAVQHPNYQPTKTPEYEEDWVLCPTDGYGTEDLIRQALISFKPDILYFMTDPRFYEWLWKFEDEIRSVVPMVYYHVWDNFPAPKFNKPYYESNDFIATISKVTSQIVKEVSPGVEEKYIPHAVNSDIFCPPKSAEDKIKIQRLREQNNLQDKFVCFWNNRNARRKQSGSLMFWWKAFLDEIGHDKATLILHTDVNDPHGQPLEYLAEHLGLTGQNQIMFSKQKVEQKDLANFYKISDCTINVSDAEGFGLATLESLSCETPIAVVMTGGLQEQVTDGKNWFGVGMYPTSQAVIGSLQCPWIFEDRISEEVFVESMKKLYNMSQKERQELGKMGREHVMKNYNFENFNKTWVETMLHIHEKYGSWSNRKNHERIN